MEQDRNEICTIRIMFPVESDDQAIDCKKKIKAVLGDIPDVNFQFSLTELPNASPDRTNSLPRSS